MRQKIKLQTDIQTIAEWTTGQPVENEQQFKAAWQTANDLAAVLGHGTQEKSHKEAGFVQAFVATEGINNA